jgi:hypothetical protein
MLLSLCGIWIDGCGKPFKIQYPSPQILDEADLQVGLLCRLTDQGCSSGPIKKDQACRVPCGKVRIESVDLPSRRDNNRRFSTIIALKVCYLLRQLRFNSEKINLGNFTKV